MSNPNNSAAITVTMKLTPADAAKILTKTLKASFPGVKFTRKLGRGTAWGSLDVFWTDGPTVAEVDSVCAPFVGKGFDGMTDSTTHIRTAIVVDGVAFESGIGFISTSRHASDKAVAVKVADLSSRWEATNAIDTLEDAARMILRGTPEAIIAETRHLRRVNHLRAV